MSQAEKATPTHPIGAPGISGRRLLPVVVIILALLCSGVAYFVTVVHKIQQARDKTAAEWRSLAVLLDHDYQAITKQLEQNEEGIEFSNAQRVQLTSAVDQFRTSVDFSQQRKLSERVEELVREFQLSAPAPPELRDQVQVYNENLAVERAMLQSTGGQIVRIFLVIPELQNFEFSR